MSLAIFAAAECLAFGGSRALGVAKSEPGALPWVHLGPPGSTGLLKLQVLLRGAFFSERRVAG